MFSFLILENNFIKKISKTVFQRVWWVKNMSQGKEEYHKIESKNIKITEKKM